MAAILTRDCVQYLNTVCMILLLVGVNAVTATVTSNYPD